MGIQYWKQDGIPVAELTGPEKRIVDAPSALELAMTARGLFHPQHRPGGGDFGEIHPVPDQNGRLRRLFLLYQQASAGFYL